MSYISISSIQQGYFNGLGFLVLLLSSGNVDIPSGLIICRQFRPIDSLPING